MASGPITSWEIDGETVSNFIFWGSKIHADGDCSHEIGRNLLLGRKVMTKLDSIFKSRDITLPTKVHLVKAMVIPVVMYGCESWTVKKAEHRRIDAFGLGCWRKLLRVPWTARRSNPFILKQIIPSFSYHRDESRGRRYLYTSHLSLCFSFMFSPKTLPAFLGLSKKNSRKYFPTPILPLFKSTDARFKLSVYKGLGYKALKIT